ncbi:MAG: alpha/beta fold hydrolase [Pseudoxanthomonas sp.]
MSGKLLLGTALLLVLAYAGICALLFFKQRGLIYYPHATRVTVEQTDYSLAHGGLTLRGWRLNPATQRAVIYFGGNAERLESSREEFARGFPDRTVYLVSYRGYGASEGEPSQDALFGDALALYDEVAARHPDAPIAVIGRSLGSGVASYLASQRPVERLALVTPFDSLAAVAQSHYQAFPVRWLMRDGYDSTSYLPRYRGPLLVLRAGRDEVIPPASTNHLLAALPNKPKVIDFPSAGHNDISDDAGYAAALGDFLR